MGFFLVNLIRLPDSFDLILLDLQAKKLQPVAEGRLLCLHLCILLHTCIAIVLLMGACTMFRSVLF